MSKRNRAPVPVLDDQVAGTATTDELEPEASPTNPLAPEQPTPVPPAVACPLPLPAPELTPCCSPGLALPLADSGSGYGSRQTHLDLRLRGAAADFVDRLRRGLNEQSARLADGKHVRSANDAVKWLLEQHILAQVQGS